MANAIEVQNLVKRYKKSDRRAVDGISFDVGQGELFAFLGPNGAGKTTTISILTTTLAKTGGSVTINGYDLDRETKDVRRASASSSRTRASTCICPARRTSASTSASTGSTAIGPSTGHARRVSPARRSAGRYRWPRGDQIFKPLKTFSGGMKRKLEIIRSLMHRPGVLFLDEPTSGLDPVSRRDVWNYLRSVRDADGTTIFLTTHYLDEAEEADRVCVIDHGKISVLGTPDELKGQLLERAILLDASDRPALLAELRALGLASD